MNHKASTAFWTLLCSVTLAALAGACGGTENEVTPTAAVERGTPASGDIGAQAISAEKIPERDLFDLVRRLGAASRADLKRTVDPPARPYQEGDVASFWVADLDSVTAHTITATVKLVSQHAYWYVDDSLSLSLEDLREAARAFEETIHPTITGALGDIWDPGVDNDPRLTVLHTRITGAEGYFGAQDEFPVTIHPRSNEREMIYMDGLRLRPGSALYLSVLAHEFHHAVHWNLDPSEDSWVDEGMSEVASELAGHRALHVASFLRNPGSQLNYWPGEAGATGPHYGASTLFFSYLAQHYGGYEGLAELVRQPADGALGVDAYLAPYDATFRGVFKDWVIANYLDAPSGPFGYPDRRVSVRDVDLVVDYGEKEGTLPQFAAAYVDLRLSEGDALVEFQGSRSVAQFGAACHSGRLCWWSNRGDAIDTTLTREIDLSGRDRATLRFWTRFEIEEDWDYVYVEISTDGGETWTTLQGEGTTSEDPVGNNLGHGFTGSSGGWVRERMDLSPYTGSPVLLRFEYVTDASVYLDGFALDDVSVPELDFFDDAELDRGWEAAGFVRTDNTLRQEYFVQVIEIGADGAASVRDLPLNDAGSGQTVIEGFGSSLRHAVIVVSPVTLGTHQPAEYKIVITPSG